MPVLIRSLFALCQFGVLAWCGTTQAQVRHCVTPDGQSVFTDRGCEAFGGVEQAQPRAADGATVEKKRGGGCARNIDDLLFEMNGAFDAHDANRLAGVYHWAGMSGSSAYNVMERLDAIVQRPVVDIVPVMPEEAPPAAEPAPYPAFEDAPVAEPAPAAKPPRTPIAVRVEQTQLGGIAAVRTVFGLQKHFGCWWIKG
ncbi:hypothetical protein [Lysobacter sp. FW306-1B-D06B]|uniref:hypothetical protein n=1 Tax=Lysobacter sp. FW306-1B-D06B TaxID=3140250 RepID=UPI0031401922